MHEISWKVVYLLIPTSNHNLQPWYCRLLELYIFWFLHQTTTWYFPSDARKGCISFDSYIKPQLGNTVKPKKMSCISFDSYIKPQLFQRKNEGYKRCISFDSYIKPQHHFNEPDYHDSCISFDSYIKPQLLYPRSYYIFVVYLLIPTSNHNMLTTLLLRQVLYIFWFLHQTTTCSYQASLLMRCISFDSYIKPQPVLLVSR